MAMFRVSKASKTRAFALSLLAAQTAGAAKARANINANKQTAAFLKVMEQHSLFVFLSRQLLPDQCRKDKL
jgi:hypothetical protein